MLEDNFFQLLSVNEVFLRVVLGVFAGSLIGLERLLHHKVAGLKTNTLVCLGATIFGMIATNSAFIHNWSASQFAIGVITGVGFLGSGIILQGPANVQGVNSAATIWVASAVGLSLGMGEFGLGLVSLAAILTVQYTHRRFEAAVVSRENQKKLDS